MVWCSAGVANALYVPCIIGCFTIAESPTLGNLAGWLLVILVLTLACKLVLEGRGSFPPGLHSWTGLRCLGAPCTHLCWCNRYVKINMLCGEHVILLIGC